MVDLVGDGGRQLSGGIVGGSAMNDCLNILKIFSSDVLDIFVKSFSS